jgi:hypothetical protein
MKTELKIYGNNIWFNVDLYDDEPLPLTKEIKDLYEPDKSQSDFTKTIKIPGTQNNDKIFSNIFDINHSVIATSQFTSDFNPNLKVNCILLKDGIPQIKGYLQLTNIILLDEYKCDYEVIVIGRNANLFQDLGDLKLTDLDLSDYNHIWNDTNIEESWIAPVGEGYVYPLIDRGFKPSEIYYYYDQTYPAVYVKTLVDKIFSEAGYRYSSTFFDSDRFKRLIIPFTGAKFKMSEAEVQDRLFELAFNSDSAYITNPSGGFTKVLFPNTIKDSDPTGIALNGWEIPTGYAANYIFRTELNCTIKYIGASSYSNDSVIFNARIIIVRSGVTSVINSNLVTIPWDGAITTNSTLDITYNLQTAITDFIAGDEFYVEWFFTTVANLLTPTDLQIKFNAGSSFFNSTDGQYNFGSTISLSSSLPQDTKQKDLLVSLINMFNLYFEPDQIDDKKLIIEPRDTFYNTTTIDLTDKLDVSKEINILPMGALDFKTLEFHQQKDDDQYNKYYNDRYKDEYGFRRVVVSNDFLVQTKKIETIFAPTPLVDADNNNRVISKIRYFNSDGTLKVQAAKPRILYYGGLLDTGLGTYSLSTSRLVPNFKTQYAYAGHLDSVASPTFDLNFGVPELIFWGSGTSAGLSDANLYNLYWKKTIDEITDKNSKLLQCYIHFNNVDLQNISFRNLYLIDRQLYRLYRIETDLNSYEPAKCTFLKLQTAPTFTPSSGTANGGSGSIGDEALPDLVYYNPNQFADIKEQMKFEIVSTDEVIYLEPRSQFVKSTTDVYLPDAGSAYDYVSNKTIEIKVYNNDGATIKVFYGDDLYFNVSSNGAHSFVTDGTTWFKF